MRLTMGIVGCCAAVALASCATVPPAVITHPFEATDLDWSKSQGSNTITGSALLRTVGGDVKTCGALEVQLIPESPYVRERMLVIYGSDVRGYTSGVAINWGRIPQPDPGLFPYVRQTTCNAQGQFTFRNLPDGAYYVVATVTWGAPTGYGLSTQGGRLMQKVEVRGAETKEAVLSS